MSNFKRDMAKATALTKAGKLAEATALIQQALLGGDAPAPTDDQTIEGSFTRLTDPAPPAAQPMRKPRSPLRDTLNRIAAGGMPAQSRKTPAMPETPAGAVFADQNFASPGGSRAYKLYTPAHQAASMPLVVMLHGCTQSPDDFALGTGMNALAEEFGCVIAYPAQPAGANAQKCWNWFRPEDQGRSGEPALIAGITRQILRDPAIDPARVYIAGLSAGGAAAVIVAQAYPEIFAAAGVHSGLPVGSARDIPSAFMAMSQGSRGVPLTHPVPMIVFHGDADATVHPGNGQAITAQAQAVLPRLSASVEHGVAEGGRGYTKSSHSMNGRSMLEDWVIQGAGHAWAGGNRAGSYTDPTGPDASREMLRFFLQHSGN